MSVIDTTNIIVGNSATPSQNFKFIANNDGSLTVQRADGSQTVLTIDANGYMRTPGTVQSMVRLNTANGYGSTNTVIRRFSGVVTNQGTDITYTDSATLGASFTINTNGVYAISYSDQFSTAQDMGISLNSSAPTTRIASLPTNEILASAYTSGANLASCPSGSFYLFAGSIIRPHTFTNTTGANPNLCQFTITRIS